MSTGLIWHESYMWHDSGAFFGPARAENFSQPAQHPESPETKRRFKNLLDISGLTEQLTVLTPRPATDEEILRLHSPDHLAHIRAVGNTGGNAGTAAHCHMAAGGDKIAILAAGGVITAVDAVLDGTIDNAYALVRPPGHHAEPEDAMGFCFFGNGAIAGLHLLEARGLDRIAYVDWDVHHGNGTQRAFWEDPRALTISLHQDNCFPLNSGTADEIGEGKGEGYAINISLPPGSGVGAYIAAFERVVIPALETFNPDFIIVPSGFDGGDQDPLGRMMLHSDAYRAMTKMLMEAAHELCAGRMVMCHEGGYSIYSVPYFGLAVMEQLSGIKTEVVDPYLAVMARKGYQDLQPHQDTVITSVEPLARGCT